MKHDQMAADHKRLSSPSSALKTTTNLHHDLSELTVDWQHVDFSEEFNGWDIIFLLEDGRIFCMKALLSAHSPVFRHMFELQYKENSEIPLPGKVFSEMQLLFQCLKPSTKLREIADEDLVLVLHLSSEFRIDHLRERCIRQMLETWTHRPDKHLAALVAGFKVYLPLAKQRQLSHILLHKDDIPKDVFEEILEEKLLGASLSDLQRCKDEIGCERYTSVLFSRMVAAEQQNERLRKELEQLKAPQKHWNIHA